MITMNEVQKDLYVSWEQYNDAVITIAKQIKTSNSEFDQIVAIARGGMFIGDSLSRIFKKPFAVLVASSYHNQEQSSLSISKEIAFATDTLGKRILLVDDLVDSGTTLEKVKSFIFEKHQSVQTIQTAVLWRKSGSTFEPDYFAGDVDRKTWIHQPFEVFDDMSL